MSIKPKENINAWIDAKIWCNQGTFLQKILLHKEFNLPVFEIWNDQSMPAELITRTEAQVPMA